MTARLRTITSPDLPHTKPWVALVCDECGEPIVLNTRHDDYMLRTWAIGCVPAELKAAQDRHHTERHTVPADRQPTPTAVAS